MSVGLSLIFKKCIGFCLSDNRTYCVEKTLMNLPTKPTGIVVVSILMCLNLMLWAYRAEAQDGGCALEDKVPASSNAFAATQTGNAKTDQHSMATYQWDTSELVSKELARRAAEVFLQDEKKRTSSNSNQDASLSKFHITRTKLIIGENNRLLAYVHVLNPEGFIITSGYTGIRPVISFSFKGSFSFQETPDNRLLDLLKADMTARLKSLATQTDKSDMKKNIIQWKQFNSEEGNRHE